MKEQPLLGRSTTAAVNEELAQADRKKVCRRVAIGAGTVVWLAALAILVKGSFFDNPKHRDPYRGALFIFATLSLIGVIIGCLFRDPGERQLSRENAKKSPSDVLKNTAANARDPNLEAGVSGGQGFQPKYFG